jgi:hypothetical protein
MERKLNKLDRVDNLDRYTHFILHGRLSGVTCQTRLPCLVIKEKCPFLLDGFFQKKGVSTGNRGVK